jgi:hypothetical protein
MYSVNMQCARWPGVQDRGGVGGGGVLLAGMVQDGAEQGQERAG